MTFTEEFQSLLNREEEVECANIFILKNDRPKKIKVFPDEVSSILLGQYFEKLRYLTREKEFVPYIPDIVDKGTLQVLPVESIALWDSMIDARNSLRIINAEEIKVQDYNCEGNTILVDLEFLDHTHAYFLTIYKNISAWFRNSMWFKKTEGRFRRESTDILALTPFVDAVIFGGKCFIIQEQNFNKIFKYEEVINKQVEEHRDEIASLDFIGDIDNFMQFLQGANRYKKAMAKVVSQRRIEKIKNFSASEIRRKIQEQPQLSFIQFNEIDEIIINDESCKAIVDILRGAINIDLITGELNGLEKDEQNTEINVGD